MQVPLRQVSSHILVTFAIEEVSEVSKGYEFVYKITSDTPRPMKWKLKYFVTKSVYNLKGK